MSWQTSVVHVVRKLEYVKTTLKDRFTGRDQVIDLMVLATVCREHMLLIGPPGTAKTDLISRFCRMVDANAFHYLLTRFTEPSELFGPLDVQLFQKGQYHIRTEGMLPTAHIAFLDEVFQGNSAILNALLTLVNERLFFNGTERQVSPLITLVGASNNIPDDPWLRAFADRFALRLEILSSGDDQIDDLLEKGWALERDRSAAPGELNAITYDELSNLNSRITEVRVAGILAEYGHVVRELRSEGVDLSDRRLVKGLKLIAGAALLRGADEATGADLWPMLHMWARPEEAEVIRRVLTPRLADAGVAVAAPVRAPEDIQLDLEVIVGLETGIKTESALGAHLRRLGELRRELIVNHPGAVELRKEIDAAIQRGIERLQVTYV